MTSADLHRVGIHFHAQWLFGTGEYVTKCICDSEFDLKPSNLGCAAEISNCNLQKFPMRFCGYVPINLLIY